MLSREIAFNRTNVYQLDDNVFVVPVDRLFLQLAGAPSAGAIIERYEGHVAQYLGDGLMIYFGWPTAHEDFAQFPRRRAQSPCAREVRRGRARKAIRR